MQWYYALAGKQMGPVDDAAMAVLVTSGQINDATMVWREGMGNWLPYRDVRLGNPALPMPSAAAVPAGQAVCAECGGVFPMDDTIAMGTGRVCAGCKPIAVQKMQEGLGIGTSALKFATVGTRFAAVLLDGLIIKVVTLSIYLTCGYGFSGGMVGRRPDHSDMSGLDWILFAVSMFLGVAYETIFIAKYGATPGKMACKIKVVVADGSPMSYGRALGRYFAKMVSGAICAIGYIMAAFDEEKRALHDRMCNTRVVLK